MTEDLALVNGRVLLPDGLTTATLTTAGGRIAAIGSLPSDWTGQVIDADGLLVAPGFIDLQVNGGFGADFTRDGEAIWSVAEQLPAHGVTAFLPTIITSAPAAIAAGLAALHQRRQGFGGAEPIGLHLEGPMISPRRVGAHPVEHLLSPSLEVISGWSVDSGVRMATIAPELDGALEVIPELVDRGVTIALGHSDATADEAGEGIAAGASHITHLYNAMSPFHHRAPGMVGFTLARADVTASIIVDGVHCDPAAVLAAWNAKGPAGLALITDASAAMGMPDGTYTLGDHQVTLSGRSVRLADGSLAGTNLTMSAAVRNLVDFTDCDIAAALRSASEVPAGIVALDSKGLIEPGRDADLVVLDADLDVVLTIVAGRSVYDRQGLT